MLCNPIDRAYSDYNHKLRKSTKFQKFIREENIENFDDFVMRFSPKLRSMKDKKMTKLLEEGIYQDGKHWFSTLTGKIMNDLFVFFENFLKYQNDSYLIMESNETWSFTLFDV